MLQGCDFFILQLSQEKISERDESSSEDDVRIYQSLQQNLPPANPLMIKSNLIEICVKSIYPQSFNPLPQFQKNNPAFQEFEYCEPYIPSADRQLVTLQEYYFQNKDRIVFKKFDELNFNRVSSEKPYFATIHVNFQKKLPKAYFRDEMLIQKVRAPSSEQKIIFDSNFESGNLFCAFENSADQYDLILQNDINTRGNTQWFFFSIQGPEKNQTIKFNILNHLKTGSLFNNGLKPAIFSMRENELNGTEWVRDGFAISYFKGQIKKEYPLNTQKRYYELSFKYTFKHENDKVYFAHSYPYTYTDLLTFENSLLSNNARSQYINRKVLCTTLGGNTCDVLTITSNSLTKRSFRRGVVFLARQHPGEPQGSFVMQGVIDFLTSSDPIAEFLRTHCIFKIFPMMNVDGVVMGNYRCGLEGNDLNRRWNKPNKRQHPTVYFAKKYIKGFAKERQIILVCDLHGHSRKKGTFVYGCSYSSQVKAIERVFALLFSKLNPQMQYPSCSFRVERVKDRTARVSLWRELKINWVYTYESSFLGGQDSKHYNIKDYQIFGVRLCITLEQLVRDMIKGKDVDDGQRIMQKQLLEELTKMPLTDEQDVAGSDSSPSEDELSDEEQIKLFPIKSLNQKQKQIYWKLQQQQKKQLTQSVISKPGNQINSQRSETNTNNNGGMQSLSLSSYDEKKMMLPGDVKIRFNLKPQGLRRNFGRQLTIQRESPQSHDYIQSQTAILMVDKAVQTDDYIYKQWLIQMGKLKKQPELLSKDNFLCFTPSKSKLYKSSSHQSSVNFLIKNELNNNGNLGRSSDNRDRVDSLAIVAPGFNRKTMSQRPNMNINNMSTMNNLNIGLKVSQTRQPNASITVLPHIKQYNK